ncbi:MAG TPA: amylo-alpha-1,6-glucosidase [Candidatus Udaeobacter sp.]|jgi:glycogen debranching enzyme|nr:amylo-alpha-1,6-glucosidase [Candidatus Udaeobacter sp.]
MAREVIRIRNEFYIRSSSPRVDVRTRVLKQGDTFAVFDRFGDIESFGTGELGLYYQDTRFLSRLTLRLGKDRPLLLSSTVREDNAVMAVDATNPDTWRDSEIVIPRGTVHFFRSKILWERTCQERLRIHNFGRAAIDLSFSIEFDADFVDIFELRGTKRERRGRRLETQLQHAELVLAYEGLDHCLRRTRIVLDPPPARLTESLATFEIRLEPGEAQTFRCAIACEVNSDSRVHIRPSYEAVVQEAANALERQRAEEAQIFTQNEQFNDLLNRSLADLHMMRTQTQYGPYPYAGVPWFSTVFGRDGIITALEYLWVDPSLAHGVLAYLAATQADSERPEQDAQPGKILHEMRADEMAITGEIPFRRYYGTIDATPLFVILAGAYYSRTGDRAFVESIWSNVERALEWIDRYGDSDGDGFVEYARRSKHGLIHQGWKDSVDAVFHSDGSSAEAPIALCEVQGYVYAAKCAASGLAKMLGDTARSRELSKQAEALSRRFEKAFWCEDLSTYALALDGNKQPCQVRASNAGHCLFAGIAQDERARRVAATLTAETSFSGWGIRTVASSEARYNPMSYHNGSIWPHDNAIIAAGFSRYDLKGSAAMVLAGLLDASLFLDLHRLPELFCGFPRRPGEAPTLYPVACAPQAWASGAVFLLLEACLGLSLSAPDQRLIFSKPLLPAFLPQVTIRDLKVGDARVDLLLTRHNEGDVGVNVLRRDGELEVVLLK